MTEKEVRETFIDSQRWEEMLISIQTLAQYARLIHLVFADGKVNEGRWLILSFFTRDLCKRRPELQQQLIQEFLRSKDIYR